MKKTILVNFAVLLIFLVLIETIIFLIRDKSNDDFGFLLDRNYYHKELIDNCKQMKTHPILSHVHKHENKCKIRDGFANGINVYYDEQTNSDDEIVVTLGGSTTDGFYQHFSNGYTYPLYLSKILKEKKTNLKVINAGNGAYGSTQELLKLITNISLLNHNIKYIISLNGNNDIDNYGETSDLNYQSEPFLSNYLFNMYLGEYWINQSKPNLIKSIFPNIKYAFSRFHIKKDFSEQKQYNYLLSKNNKKNNNILRWKNNIEMMNSVSKSIGAKYFVFLQPTMGIKGPQSKILDKRSSDYKMFEELDEEYLKNLNKSHKGFKKYCKILDFCIDITHIAPPDGDIYTDPRHHGARGNLIIAEAIYDVILNNNQD